MACLFTAYNEMKRIVFRSNYIRVQTVHCEKENTMDFNDLTEEQKTRIGNAKTKEELMTIAEEEGFDLSDEELEALAGGWLCHGYNGCAVVIVSDLSS